MCFRGPCLNPTQLLIYFWAGITDRKKDSNYGECFALCAMYMPLPITYRISTGTDQKGKKKECDRIKFCLAVWRSSSIASLLFYFIRFAQMTIISFALLMLMLMFAVKWVDCKRTSLFICNNYNSYRTMNISVTTRHSTFNEWNATKKMLMKKKKKKFLKKPNDFLLFNRILICKQN